MIGQAKRRIADDTFASPEEALKEVGRRQSPQRARILNYCEVLGQLLAALKDTTSIVPHLQTLGRLRRKAEHCPKAEIEELSQELNDLMLHWKSLPAGDGEAIISAARHERFLAKLVDL